MSESISVIELTDNGLHQQVLPGEPKTCGMRSGRVYLEPEEDCGIHNTRDNEEMLIFLNGRGVAVIGKERNQIPVGEGKVSYIPPETIHNIKNTGTGPLVYIYCVSPVADRAIVNK